MCSRMPFFIPRLPPAAPREMPRRVPLPENNMNMPGGSARRRSTLLRRRPHTMYHHQGSNQSHRGCQRHARRMHTNPLLLLLERGQPEDVGLMDRRGERMGIPPTNVRKGSRVIFHLHHHLYSYRRRGSGRPQGRHTSVVVVP